MSVGRSEAGEETTGRDIREGAVSRREFLKIAGVAGAAVGLGAGMGSLVAACGEEATTITTVVAPTTAAPTTSPMTSASTTAGPTSTAGAAQGRELLVGFVAPITGPLATFGKANEYCAERWREMVSGGWPCGDGKTHPVKFLVGDSQSDTNRAAQVAGDMMMNQKVDVIIAASTPEATNPVADQAEAMGVPCYTIGAPWQAYFYGRGGVDNVGFKWTYHHFWGLEDIIAVYTAIWKRLETNKVVGALFPNDSDGAAFGDPKTGFPAVCTQLGYTLIDPGSYQVGSEDFTAQISAFKKEGVEIITGVPTPADFGNFWKQAMQQGFQPKIGTVAKALDLPPDMEALGTAGNQFVIEFQWGRQFPFTSSITGETCAQLADDFEKRVGMQAGSYLMYYSGFEVVGDTFKRCADLDDREAVIDALSKTKLDTIAGPIDFTTEPKMGTMHPVKNVSRSPLVSGQWIKGTKHPYELVVVDNSNYPQIPVEAEPRLLKYE